MSLLGVKRTCSFALHMSAYDPRRKLAALQASPLNRDYVARRHSGSKPLAARACLLSGDVRKATNPFAASTCLLSATIPSVYVV